MSKINQISEKNTTWCFSSRPNVSFDKRLFNLGWLNQQKLVTGTPEAGRGNTVFLKFDDTELVLREYLRGGMVRHINPRYYLWNGLSNTRAYRELSMLDNCIYWELPVPKAYGCMIQRKGMFYTASLITHKIKGETLADLLKLRDGELQSENPEQVWKVIGKTIARFHKEGVWHADLNAHNVLIDLDADAKAHPVSLIDFDRARRIPTGDSSLRANLSRLQRSLVKEAGKGGYQFDASGWAALSQAYDSELGNSSCK